MPVFRAPRAKANVLFSLLEGMRRLRQQNRNSNVLVLHTKEQGKIVTTACKRVRSHHCGIFLAALYHKPRFEIRHLPLETLNVTNPLKFHRTRDLLRQLQGTIHCFAPKSSTSPVLEPIEFVSRLPPKCPPVCLEVFEVGARHAGHLHAIVAVPCGVR